MKRDVLLETRCLTCKLRWSHTRLPSFTELLPYVQHGNHCQKIPLPRIWPLTSVVLTMWPTYFDKCKPHFKDSVAKSYTRGDQPIAIFVDQPQTITFFAAFHCSRYTLSYTNLHPLTYYIKAKLITVTRRVVTRFPRGSVVKKCITSKQGNMEERTSRNQTLGHPYAI